MDNSESGRLYTVYDATEQANFSQLFLPKPANLRSETVIQCRKRNKRNTTAFGRCRRGAIQLEIINKNSNFTIFPNEVLRDRTHGLKSRDKLVYGVLCSYSGNTTKSTFVSVDRVSKDCVMDARSVRRAIEKLAEVGLVDIQKRFDENGRQTSNLYTINTLPLHFRQGGE